jgi:hypothetical protein
VNRPYYGVSLANCVRRFELPGARTRSSTAEVAALMFAMGLVLGLVLGSEVGL